MKRDIFGEIREVLREMGGAGSGYYGHTGRPGQRGGSMPSSVGILPSRIKIQRLVEDRYDFRDRQGTVMDVKNRLVIELGLKEEWDEVREDLYEWAKNSDSPRGRKLVEEIEGYYKGEPVRDALMLNKMVNEEAYRIRVQEKDLPDKSPKGKVILYRGGVADRNVVSLSHDKGTAYAFAEQYVQNLPTYSGEDPLVLCICLCDISFRCLGGFRVI